MSQPDSACGICGLIARCRAGEFADYIAELPQSYVILGDAQFYRGYCVVLAKPHEREMFLLPRDQARELWDEVSAVARAIDTAVKPLKLNYECLGNEQPHVHWHIFPRFDHDPMQRAPVWIRAEAERKRQLEEHERSALIASIRAELGKLIPGSNIPGD